MRLLWGGRLDSYDAPEYSAHNWFDDDRVQGNVISLVEVFC